MKPAQTNPSWRERQVLALLAELARERCVAKRRFARLEGFLEPYLGVVDGGAVRGALRRWKRRELLRRLAPRSLCPAQIADAGSFERGLVRCRGDFRGRPVRERFQGLASHVASSRQHEARRSFGTKAGLRGTTRVPSPARAGGGRSVEALSGLRRTGFSAGRLRSEFSRRRRDRFAPALPVSLSPRVAVLLSFVAS